MIDFFFSNLGFILIILGFLVSLFQDREKKEQKKRIPTEKKKAAERKEHKSLFEEMRRSIEQKIPESTWQEKQTVISENKTKKVAETQPVQSATFHEIVEIDPIEPLLERTRKRNVQKLSNRPYIPNVSKNTVVSGIVWSEILGPPRSKKPYSSNHFHK
ncbi:hypothetical protein [Fervidibacillus halotolerans]|uniref:Uncharacterized protein n=1 Tax=Fervidibacillus halotolerans TaxID=2980027 RepID=A0A9E8LZD6_9BACI|nr:hypothetical protein [Fervidibacillus halotolerans]WAA11499.1 hypothetical protein OE105_07610 [Fervidibacillus halotolerans]